MGEAALGVRHDLDEVIPRAQPDGVGFVSLEIRGAQGAGARPLGVLELLPFDRQSLHTARGAALRSRPVGPHRILDAGGETAFVPGRAVGFEGGDRPRFVQQRTLLPTRSRSAALAASTTLPALRGATFTSAVFPGYRFTLRIFSGEQELPVILEIDCLRESLCVSGALPGRVELFLRLIGPRPNGYFWANLVRFTTSRVEAEIEQVATEERQVYVLDQVPRQSDELPGHVDREAFLPE